MTPRYDGTVVVLSLLIAAFASYVALDLARRVRGPDRMSAMAWMGSGAVVMGTGVWAMHFVGMLALQLPIPLGYDLPTTLLSWGAAVAVSLLALFIASRERLAPATLAVGALTMGGGICAMHYIGMAAVDMAPGIVWNLRWVGLSAVIAVGASAAALLIFFFVRRLQGLQARAAQVGAALVMGGAISGMHYAGMAAAGFPAGAVCLSAGGLAGESLGTMVIVATVGLLAITLMTSVLDARMQAQATLLADRLQAANLQLQQANAELQRAAFNDPLTGLSNLTLFDDRLQQALARAERHGGPCRLAVLFIDLDGFKLVNDSWGHAAGDAVLRTMAGRLSAVCRHGDSLARVGGDEFVMLLDGPKDEPEAQRVAQRVLEAVTQPFLQDGREVMVSCSIGLAMYPDHGPGQRLKSMADAAMYLAKRAGGNRLQIYDAVTHVGTDPMDLLQDLRQAMATSQLQLHYQPMVDSASSCVTGVEALLRWQHGKRGMVSPGEFVPLAERYGLIVALGTWVLDEACRQIAAWRQRGWRLRVSVNLSACQVRQPDFVDVVRSALNRHGVDPRQLVCEFTESVAMEDPRATQHTIDALGAIGVQMSFDDFGTGHSSLAMLRQLNVHELKIDRLFVCDVADDPKARDLVEAVVRLAHALGMKVVAEGVETLAQRDALVALGCDELQGYFYARPMAAAALDELGRANAEPLVFAPAVLAPGLELTV